MNPMSFHHNEIACPICNTMFRIQQNGYSGVAGFGSMDRVTLSCVNQRCPECRAEIDMTVRTDQGKSEGLSLDTELSRQANAELAEFQKAKRHARSRTKAKKPSVKKLKAKKPVSKKTKTGTGSAFADFMMEPLPSM